MAEAAGLVRADGTIGETIFGQMTQLALQHGAVNLGQGAPGTPAPDFLLEAADAAMRAGFNQYAPGQGFPELIAAVAEQREREHGHQVEPENVLITVGATEALTAAIMALVPAGSEVIVLEPFYDSYAAAIAAAGARMVTVPLLPNDAGSFAPDWQAFEAAVSPSTTAILVNTPHNPTGAVLPLEHLQRIFTAAQRADAWLITDEVYEYLVYGASHESIAAHVDEPERVVTISSAGKTFNVTGWKIGWAVAAPAVREAIQSVKQFLTFTAGSPFQPAVAQALRSRLDFPVANRDSLADRRDTLLAALRQVPGLTVREPAAGYFALVDFASITSEDALTLNERITRDFGFTGIPVASLCRAGSVTAEYYRSTIRYSFCKAPAEIEAAAERIASLGTAIAAGTFTPEHHRPKH
ncbi:aminotransferase class I/II-fold pyridoxal phosphate-dependent enzyme [Brevibacterium daeguense]|nr:aminotransferase class I/II-fold pyridoxal phosphate-dependent enzyme [Brevibacterium daeguense]